MAVSAATTFPSFSSASTLLRSFLPVAGPHTAMWKRLMAGFQHGGREPLTTRAVPTSEVLSLTALQEKYPQLKFFQIQHRPLQAGTGTLSLLVASPTRSPWDDDEALDYHHFQWHQSIRRRFEFLQLSCPGGGLSQPASLSRPRAKEALAMPSMPSQNHHSLVTQPPHPIPRFYGDLLMLVFFCGGAWPCQTA